LEIGTDVFLQFFLGFDVGQSPKGAGIFFHLDGLCEFLITGFQFGGVGPRRYQKTAESPIGAPAEDRIPTLTFPGEMKTLFFDHMRISGRFCTELCLAGRIVVKIPDSSVDALLPRSPDGIDQIPLFIIDRD